MHRNLWILIFLIASLCSYPSAAIATQGNVIDWIEEDTNPSEKTQEQEERTEQSGNEEQDGTPSQSGNGSGSLAFSLVKMFFALLLVLALIYILIKLLSKRNRLGNQVKVLENMGGISLGANKSIQIVRIGSKLYLVGVGEDVQLLQEVTEDEVIEELLSKENSNGTLQKSVLSMIERKSVETKQGNFKQLFASELDKLKQTRQKWQPKKEEDEQ